MKVILNLKKKIFHGDMPARNNTTLSQIKFKKQANGFRSVYVVLDYTITQPLTVVSVLL